MKNMIDYFGGSDKKKRKISKSVDSQFLSSEQFQNALRFWLKTYLRYSDVKFVLFGEIFDSKNQTATDAYEKFCKEKSYVYNKDQIDSRLNEFFNEKFNQKFLKYLNDNPEIKSVLSPDQTEKILDSENLEKKIFSSERLKSKIIEYLYGNTFETKVQAKIFDESFTYFHRKFSEYLTRIANIDHPIRSIISENPTVKAIWSNVDQIETRLLKLERIYGIPPPPQKKTISNATTVKKRHSKNKS